MHTHTHPATTALCEYTGTLLHNAEVRTKVLGSEGYAVPVLCCDLQLDNGTHNTVHSEQPYPAGCHSQCEAAAKRLKKGDRITVQAPLASHRLVLTNATHVRPPSEPVSPTPDLFQEPSTCPA